MAELVDARDLGSRGFARGGSSPPFRMIALETGAELMTSEAKDLQVTVDSPGSWSRRLTITVPASLVDRERRAVVQRLARSARLPGFRKGKVPAHVIEKNYGAALEQETLERAVRHAYETALEREALRPITQGAVENLDYSPGADLRFEIQFDIQPEVELSRLSGFQLRRNEQQVSDEEVNDLLDRLRQDRANWHPVDRSPKENDRVQLEVTPLDLGDESEETEADPQRYDFILGSGQAMPEVEAAVQELEPEAERELTLPENEQGKQPRIRIRLVEVKEAELPEPDDEFAKGVGDFEGIEDLRRRIRDKLEGEARVTAERELRGQLMDQILEANPFDLPDSMVDHSLEQLFPPQDNMPEEEVSDMRASARPAAERALKRQLVIEKVARQEEIQATPDEVNERIRTIAKQQGMSESDLRSQLKKAGRIAQVAGEVTEEKVFQHLLSTATIE